MFEMLMGLLIATAVSGVIPLINAELLVLGAAAAAPAALLPAVVLASTVGQMATKTGLFAVARWMPSRLPEKANRAITKATKSLEDRGGAAGSIVFASAASGLPPFYGVSLAAGALGLRTSVFVASGVAGRTLRFGVLAWAGHRFGSGAIDALLDMGLPSFVVGG